MSTPYAEILRTDFVQSNLTLFIEQFCLQFTDTDNLNNFGQMFEAVCRAKHKDVTLYMLSHPAIQRCSYDIIVKCICVWITHRDTDVVKAFVEFALTNPNKECYRSTVAFEALRAACYDRNADMCIFVLFESGLAKHLSSQMLGPFYEPLRDVLTAEDMARLGDLDKN